MTCHRALKGGIPERKDTSVGSHQPITGAITRRGDPDNWLVEVNPGHGSVERSAAHGEDSSVRSNQPEALWRGSDPHNRSVEIRHLCACSARTRPSLPYLG